MEATLLLLLIPLLLGFLFFWVRFGYATGLKDAFDQQYGWKGKYYLLGLFALFFTLRLLFWVRF